jgi:hypothetical protein
MTVPPEITGRAYFDQKLKEFGIPREKIPDAMRDEIVKSALDNAMGTGGVRAMLGIGRNTGWRGEFRRSLQGEVVVIYLILFGRSNFLNTPLHARLVRYGVVKK